MEDIRPYRSEENDRRDEERQRRDEWELARLDTDEELSFDIPRD